MATDITYAYAAAPANERGDVTDEYCADWTQDIVRDHDGKVIDDEAAAILMDDDLREELHSDLAGECTKQEFFNAYAAAHAERFGEDFDPMTGGQW